MGGIGGRRETAFERYLCVNMAFKTIFQLLYSRRTVNALTELPFLLSMSFYWDILIQYLMMVADSILLLSSPHSPGIQEIYNCKELDSCWSGANNRDLIMG